MREHPPVVIKAPPTCVLERSKKRLELPCRAVGYPIPTITWTKVRGQGDGNCCIALLNVMVQEAEL